VDQRDLAIFASETDAPATVFFADRFTLFVVFATFFFATFDATFVATFALFTAAFVASFARFVVAATFRFAFSSAGPADFFTLRCTFFAVFPPSRTAFATFFFNGFLSAIFSRPPSLDRCKNRSRDGE
jgi:hypothetical protein